MYFIGNDIYSVDHKGRVFIPVKFRAVLNEEDDNSFYKLKDSRLLYCYFP